MSQADDLTRAVRPNDEAGRGALADALREEGFAALADAVGGPGGEKVLGDAVELAKQVGMPVSVFLVWAAYELVPRMRAAGWTHLMRAVTGITGSGIIPGLTGVRIPTVPPPDEPQPDPWAFSWGYTPRRGSP